MRALIVDDEPLAREGLSVRLERERDVEIVGEAVDGPSALRAIAASRPDVVFLDVQMPGLDGFEVVERIAEEHRPLIVFVTAYDRYALKAFDAHAIDYLLKPVTHRRFQDTLRRVRAAVSGDGGGERVVRERLEKLLASRRSPATREPGEAERGRSPAGESGERYLRRLMVKDGDRFLLVKASDVDWIESAANYVRLHVGSETHQLRMTMTDLERRLDPERFARIHRSTIINLDRVKEIRSEWHGDYDVVLHGGTRLRLSRSYRDRVMR